MKTKKEIETKLQDVEAHILNMEEAARASEDKTDAEIYTAARDAAIEQAKVLKWVLI
jgi:hypothetical protein